MIEMHEGPKQSDFCELAGLLAAYLQKHEDGADRLREFLTDERGLWDTQDVCTWTGWQRQYISQLCSRGTLPYIPGRPNKFVPAAVKKSIEAMQLGGPYGRRKSTIKGRK